MRRAPATAKLDAEGGSEDASAAWIEDAAAFGAVHRTLRHAQRSLELTEVFLRRKLRHAAQRRCSSDYSATTQHGPQRRRFCSPRFSISIRSRRARVTTWRTSPTLPTEAAVHWYHDKSANKGRSQSVVNEARTFANGRTHRGADAGRPLAARSIRADRTQTRASYRPEPSTISSSPICASSRNASKKSCCAKPARPPAA